jgi:hypothetical protein
LCGLWLPVWLFAAIGAESKPFLCPICGANLGRHGGYRTGTSPTFLIACAVLTLILIRLVVWIAQ